MKGLTYGSVASGIEAASQAFQPLGWKPAWFSEIEPFPCSVLSHHHPDVPNVGDMRKLPALIADGSYPAPDVFCGGTPCQAFSVAGLRKGLSDDRGALTLTFCEIANEIDAKRCQEGKEPAIVIWENVVGALSSSDNAFGCFLAALAGEADPLEPAGGKWSHAGCVFGPDRAVAWRVLDAQFFGVPQRRRRVVVVACPLERAHPTAILFELEGSAGGAPQGGWSPEITSPYAAQGAGEHGDQPYDVANCLTRRMHKGLNTTLDEGQTPIVAFPAYLSGTQCASTPDVSCSLGAKNPTAVAYVKGTNPHSAQECPTFRETETAARLNGWDARHSPPKHIIVEENLVTRLLLPIECERLQGFPDNFTDIPGASDTKRYMALGNSWAVPKFAWLGRRIVAHLEGRI